MLYIMWTRKADEANYLLGKQRQQFSITNYVCKIKQKNPSESHFQLRRMDFIFFVLKNSF